MNHRIKLTSLLVAAILLLSGGGAAGYLLAADETTSQAKDPRAPSGWSLYVNPKAGYSIAYPGGWHAVAVTPEEISVLFDRQRIILDPNAGWPPVDLEVIANAGSFDEVLSTKTASDSRRTVRREDTTVAGLAAVKLETVATDGVFEPGTRVYGYVLNRDGKAFTIETIVSPTVSAADHDELREIVDAAADSLRFDA